MRYEIVDGDLRYLRNICPMTISTVTGCGPGAVCRCECEPEPEKPPIVKIRPTCKTNVSVKAFTRYRAPSSANNLRVC